MLEEEMALFSQAGTAGTGSLICVYTKILAIVGEGIYTGRMDIVYDAAKSASNVIKRGISLAETMGFEWNDAVVWSDERQDYGEIRLCALGYIGPRLYLRRVCVARQCLPRNQSAQGEFARGETVCPSLNPEQ